MEMNPHPIEHLINFVHHLEEELASVKRIHEKFFQLISILSNTHQNILQDLNNIKSILNQTTIQQEQNQLISIDRIKSPWNDDDDDDETRKLNKSFDSKENLTIDSTSLDDSLSTIENASTTKCSSNLKKSAQFSLSIKSPKSVTFSFDENLSHQQQQPKRTIPTFQQFTKEKRNPTYPELTTPINPSLSSDFLKQNRLSIAPKIGKQLTNVRIHEIESKNGDYLRLLNISNSDDYDLSEHFLQQTIDSKLLCRFRFPFDTIIKAGHTITVWCGRSKGILSQPPHVFLWKEQRKWETKPECLTILAKPNGQSISWYQSSYRVSPDQPSSDILYVHSTINSGSSDVSTNISSTSTKDSFHPTTKSNLFSSFHFFGNKKPPFAHSPTNPIHPDYNASIIPIATNHRSQTPHKNKVSQLLNRPKSSPFASHTGCKQDLMSINALRGEREQTTVKN